MQIKPLKPMIKSPKCIFIKNPDTKIWIKTKHRTPPPQKKKAEKKTIKTKAKKPIEMGIKNPLKSIPEPKNRQLKTHYIQNPKIRS